MTSSRLPSVLPKIEAPLQRRLQALKRQSREGLIEGYSNLCLKFPLGKKRQETSVCQKGSKEKALQTTRYCAITALQDKENAYDPLPSCRKSSQHEIDIQDIFIKRNRFSIWSRKSALLRVCDHQRKVKPREVTSPAQPIFEKQKESLTGWYNEDQPPIQNILMEYN